MIWELGQDATGKPRCWTQCGPLCPIIFSPNPAVVLQITRDLACRHSAAWCCCRCPQPVHQDQLAWWSYQPVRQPAVPKAGAGWAANEIDHFIAQICRTETDPGRSAAKRALIRRVTLDLTGLPPTPEQVAAFLKDPSPDAYGKLVAAFWPAHATANGSILLLDLVRYADSDGYARIISGLKRGAIATTSSTL